MKFALPTFILFFSIAATAATPMTTNNDLSKTQITPSTNVPQAPLDPYATPQTNSATLNRTSMISPVPWANGPSPVPTVPGVMPMNSNPMLLDYGGTSSGVTSGAETFGAPSGL